MVIISSAPGKLMLLGEHAVLYGSQCLVCAVNQRIQIRLSPLPEPYVEIHSDLGSHRCGFEELVVCKPFTFILEAIRQFLPQLRQNSTSRKSQGLRLQVDSEFNHQVGLGSSAATTVATVAALQYWLEQKTDLHGVFQRSLAVIENVQGVGSGADLAASVYGGLLLYRKTPQEIKRFESWPDIVVISSEHKEKTVDVIQKVRQGKEDWKNLYHGIFALMNTCCEEARHAIEQKNWPRLGQVLNVNQGLMDAIGVNNLRLSQIIYNLREDPGIYGSKISGSGLGDCVVAIGCLQKASPLLSLPLQISPNGVEVKSQV